MLNRYVKNLNGKSVMTLNTREMHEFMGVHKQYSVWIKTRLNSFKLVEGVDYSVEQRVVTGVTARPYVATDYYIAFDVAINLSLCEYSGKGVKAYMWLLAMAETDKLGAEPPKTYAECLQILADVEAKLLG